MKAITCFCITTSAMLALPAIVQAGGLVSPSTPEEFAEFLRADVARWAKIVKQTGSPSINSAIA